VKSLKTEFYEGFQQGWRMFWSPFLAVRQHLVNAVERAKFPPKHKKVHKVFTSTVEQFLKTPTEIYQKVKEGYYLVLLNKDGSVGATICPDSIWDYDE